MLRDVVGCCKACKKKEDISHWFGHEILGYEEAYEKKNGGSKINHPVTRGNCGGK